MYRAATIMAYLEFACVCFVCVFVCLAAKSEAAKRLEGWVLCCCVQNHPPTPLPKPSRTHTPAHQHACMHSRMCMCAHTHTNTCTHTPTHTQIRTPTHPLTHIGGCCCGRGRSCGGLRRHRQQNWDVSLLFQNVTHRLLALLGVPGVCGNWIVQLSVCVRKSLGAQNDGRISAALSLYVRNLCFSSRTLLDCGIQQENKVL